MALVARLSAVPERQLHDLIRKLQALLDVAPKVLWLKIMAGY